jgi:hypothetical protein
MRKLVRQAQHHRQRLAIDAEIARACGARDREVGGDRAALQPLRHEGTERQLKRIEAGRQAKAQI